MTSSTRPAAAGAACLLSFLLFLPATRVSGQAGPLWGFADTHTHQFANLGFGGALLIGEPFHPGAPAGRELEYALTKCEYATNFLLVNPLGIPIPGIPFFGQPLHHQTFSPDLIGLFLDGGVHAVEGYPNFNGWPHYRTHTHQQMYWEWLHRAYLGGLRLMVMLAVNNEVLCGITNRRLGFGCDDMSSVDRQIQGAKDLEAYIDGRSGGPGLGWYRIAYSGRQAREIIASGKLAVVLGIEVDDLFGCVQNPGLCTPEYLRGEIQRYHDLGVRHIFPIHLFDNAFGGAALYDDFFNLGNALAVGSYYQVDGCGPDSGYGYDFDPGTDPILQGFLNFFPFLRAFIPTYPPGPHCNAKGLTATGETLLRELMTRGMIIDLDHMSGRAANRALDLCEEAGYPAVAGHTGFKDITLGEQASEVQKTAPQVERLRRLGGLVGTALNQGELGEIAHFDSRIPLTCGNSSQTFAQAYLYAVNAMDGAAVAVGSDFNGLAGMPGPRFHPRCSGQGNPISYPFLVHGGGAVLDKHIAGNRMFNYNADGFAHIGLYPDFIEDLKVQGLTAQDLAPLFRSAEAYVRMWERIDARTYAPCGARRPAAFNLSTGFDETTGQLIANSRADDNFEVEGPFGLGLGVTCATVVPDNQYPIGPWMASTAGSKWIGLPSPNSEGPPGEYVFRLTVNVPAGINAASLTLAGGWAADDVAANIIVNHISTGLNGGGNGFATLTPFPPQAARGFFHPGENVVEFVIVNGGTSLNPIGLRVEAVIESITGVDLVVEQSIVDFARVHAGDSFHITDSFANQPAAGDTAFGAVARYWLFHRFLGEHLIGERHLPPLAPGARSEGTTRVTVPEGLPPETYNLRVEVTAPPPATERDPTSNNLNLPLLQVLAAPSQRFFADDFNRTDGTPAGWTADSCAWRLAGGTLATGPTGNDECWIWPGAPPVTAPGRMIYSFDYRFLSPGNNAEVGRHGGFAFAASRPTRRLTGDFSGYVVDWIDRADDHGFRLTFYEGLLAVPIVAGGAGMPAQPPLHWRIDVSETRIQVAGDGVLYIDAPKFTISGGHFGFWAWAQGQTVAIDNLIAETAPFQAAFQHAPGAPLVGSPVAFDAGASSVATGVEVAAYDWDFGDGTSGNGRTASHIYGAAGEPVVTLTVTDRLGRVSASQKRLRVHEPLAPFADCFNGQTGPPAEWQAQAGVWGTGNGTLTGTARDERDGPSLLLAGSSPRGLPADFTAEVELLVEPPSFSTEPFAGGVVFCATEPVRFEQGLSGYAVALAPIEPRGVRLGLYYLFHGQREPIQELDLVSDFRPQPGRLPFLRLRIEVAGEVIRILAQNELVIEFYDLAFRGGFFGLFAEGGSRLRADNVRLPPRRPPCALAVTAFTIAEDPGHVYVQGTGSGGDPCLGPEECGCAEVGVSIAGLVREVVVPGGNPLLVRIPVPDGCTPESRQVVTARCLEEETFGPMGEAEFTCPTPPPPPPPVGGTRLPGDCNADGALNISDPICLLGFLFSGKPDRLPCGKEGRADEPGNRSLLDHNGDKKVDLSDAVATLNYLFSGGAPPKLGQRCAPIEGCDEPRERCRQ